MNQFAPDGLLHIDYGLIKNLLWNNKCSGYTTTLQTQTQAYIYAWIVWSLMLSILYINILKKNSC